MDGLIATGFLPEPQRSTVNGNLATLGSSASLSCAAHEYRMAAGGHCHVMLYNKLDPWDHAAGWLLTPEARSSAAQLDPTPYTPHPRHTARLTAPYVGRRRSTEDRRLGASSDPGG